MHRQTDRETDRETAMLSAPLESWICKCATVQVSLVTFENYVFLSVGDFVIFFAFYVNYSNSCNICCNHCTVNFVVHLVKSRLLELSLVLFHVVFFNYYYCLLFVIATICGE